MDFSEDYLMEVMSKSITSTATIHLALAMVFYEGQYKREAL